MLMQCPIQYALGAISREDKMPRYYQSGSASIQKENSPCQIFLWPMISKPWYKLTENHWKIGEGFIHDLINDSKLLYTLKNYFYI